MILYYYMAAAQIGRSAEWILCVLGEGLIYSLQVEQIMFLGPVAVGLGRIEPYKVMAVPPQLWSASSATAQGSWPMRKPNHTSMIVTALIIFLDKISCCILVLSFVVLLATLLDNTVTKILIEIRDA